MIRSVARAFRRNPRDGAIAAMAIPALGTLAIDPLVSIVDTAWVGRLGTVPLAALAVASAVFGAVFAVFNFVHVTITPLVAGEVGRGAPERAGGITKGAIVVSLVLGVVLAFVVGSFAEAIVGAFGATGDVLEQSVAYLKVRILALPAMLVVMVGHGVYRGHQDTRTPLYVAIGMNLINLVVDPILIFGAGMGVVGAAWATVLAQMIAAAV
ncbi:MAG: MATE family efflux transporter, partial [Acidimicrobiia bacterium]